MFEDVFELAERGPSAGPDLEAFQRLYDVRLIEALCSVGPYLQEKYGVGESQRVVGITERTGNGQSWFNIQRRRKPTDFASKPAQLTDPRESGKQCDFCNWQECTAEDTFGRIQLPHAVSASNLFKCCAPFHGVVLFRRHHPLEFTLPELGDLMRVSQEWFRRARETDPAARFPLLVWNCLSRAGASQFHGHAQVMLSSVPFPSGQTLQQTAERYSGMQARGSYYQDLLRAHNAVGLLRTHQVGQDRAWCYAALAQKKDAEVDIQADSLSNEALHVLLYCALKALFQMGFECFNVGILNIPMPNIGADGNASESPGVEQPPLVVRLVSRGRVSQVSSDFGGLEVWGGANIGHTDPFHLIQAIDHQMALLSGAATS